MNTTHSPVRLGLQINEIDSGYSKALVESLRDLCASEKISLIVFSGRAYGWPFGFEYQNTAIFSHISPVSCDALVVASGTQCNFITREEFFQTFSHRSDLPRVSMSVVLTDTPSIVIDNETGFRAVIEHILEIHGCKRVAVLCGPQDNPDSVSRLLTLHQILRERGLSIRMEDLFRGDFSYESGYAVGARLCPPDFSGTLPFDAVVAFNDLMALGLMRRFAEAGIRVPEDIVVTGFDDVVRAHYSEPSLTTARQNLTELGSLAGRLALSMIRGEQVPLVSMLPTEAKFRQSCGCIARDDYQHDAKLADGSMLLWPDSLLRDMGLERFTLEDDLVHLRQYLAFLQTADSIEAVAQSLRADLESFNIKSAALVLFSDPVVNKKEDRFILPASANLILHYDETVQGNGYSGERLINPAEGMLPGGWFSPRPRMLVATSLYHRDNQLGYLVYEPGDRTPAIYEALSVQLSAVIYSTWLFASKKNAEERLRDTLRDLESINRRLDTLSRQDDLTGLLNRRGFMDAAGELFSSSRSRSQNFMLFALDLDGLKKINDSFGHDTGDRAIQGVAEVLRRIFRTADVLARIGGDEFAVAALDPGGQLSSKIDQRIRAALEEWNTAADVPFVLDFSYGYVSVQPEGINLDDLISRADAGMYRQKAEKKKNRE